MKVLTGSGIALQLGGTSTLPSLYPHDTTDLQGVANSIGTAGQSIHQQDIAGYRRAVHKAELRTF
jgi:hypothetical protein